MLQEFAKPSFGGPLRPQSYYDVVNGIIRTLKGTASLRTTAAHLNAAGLQTPSGKPWTRQAVFSYTKARSFN